MIEYEYVARTTYQYTNTCIRYTYVLSTEGYSLSLLCLLFLTGLENVHCSTWPRLSPWFNGQ